MPLLTTDEVAAVLRRKSAKTVCRLIRTGKLPGHWDGGRWLVHPDDLTALLRAMRWKGKSRK